MKKVILFVVFCFLALAIVAQTETFDITSYVPPKGWEKKPAGSAVQFIKEDPVKNIYGVLTLYKSSPSTASAKDNFDMAWASLVKEIVTVATDPEMQAVAMEDGWEIQSGYAAFESDGNKGIVLLVTTTGFEKMINLIILTNTDEYEKNITGFIESISLKKPKQAPQQVIDNNSKAAFIGSWGKSNAVGQLYNRFGNYSYNKQQYTFNANGTYSFTGKNYSESSSETLLTRESGTYIVNGNNLTLTPNNCVLEAWTKRNGADNWNQLVKSQKRPLEKTTYQYKIEENNLVLQTQLTTTRDGKFNTGNSYVYGPPGTFTAIKLPGE